MVLYHAKTKESQSQEVENFEFFVNAFVAEKAFGNNQIPQT